jgi:hypothetical protein
MTTRTNVFINATVATCALLALLQAASAASIAIVNPSFEQPVLAPGGTSSAVPGWIGSGSGYVARPLSFPHPTNGAQLAVLKSNLSFNLNDFFGQISQTLGATVAPDTLYVLRADFIGGDTPYQGLINLTAVSGSYPIAFFRQGSVANSASRSGKVMP